MPGPEAFSVFQDFAPAPAGLFCMDRHYLLYASAGAMRMEADGRQWTLAPARAALVAAGKQITVTLPQRMSVSSVLIDPACAPPLAAPLRVFDVSPLVRELILATRGWPSDAPALTADQMPLLVLLMQQVWALSTRPSPASMPCGESRPVRAALTLAQDNFEGPISLDTVARAVGQSSRSLARKFAAELGMTWSEALTRVRLLAAIEFLTAGRQSVTEVALSVGYNSPSAFSDAFRRLTGQTPRAFRQTCKRA